GWTGEARSPGGPSVRVGTARLQATTAGGGRAVVPSRGLGSFFGRFSEAVADAEHRLDVLLPDLLPDVLDVCIDRALVRLERNAPHRVKQLRPGEDPAGLPRHQSHDLELALGQVHAPAAEPCFHPLHIQLNV